MVAVKVQANKQKTNKFHSNLIKNILLKIMINI